MFAVVCLLAVSVTSGFSAVTLPTSLDVSPIESLAGIMLVALATIWVVRRVLGFMGR